MSHLSGFASISPTIPESPATSSQQHPVITPNVQIHDEATVRLHRISVAWYLLSLSISVYTLWTISHKLNPKLVSYRQIRIGICIVILGTISNSLQLVYQLFPEGNYLTSALWLIIDLFDYVSYAATVCLYVQVSWCRLQFMHDQMPSYILALIKNVYCSKHVLYLYQILMVICLLLCYVDIYTGTNPSIGPEAGTWDMCLYWYFMTSQIVAILCQLVFACVYFLTWPIFTQVTDRQNPRPDLRSILVVIVILSTIVLQLLILLEWYFKMYIWLGSRLIWMVYTTLLIGLASIFLLQIQLIQQAVTDLGPYATARLSPGSAMHYIRNLLMKPVHSTSQDLTCETVPTIPLTNTNNSTSDTSSTPSDTNGCIDSYNPPSTHTQLASLGNRDLYPFDLYALHYCDKVHISDNDCTSSHSLHDKSVQLQDGDDILYVHPDDPMDKHSLSTLKLSLETPSLNSDYIE